MCSLTGVLTDYESAQVGQSSPGIRHGIRTYRYRTVHLSSSDISSGIFSSDDTRPIHFWKAERETLRLLYRTPAAELIQTFYRQTIISTLTVSPYGGLE